MRVVAAILFDAAGRVLIAQRPAGKPMAGQWEFPGGKMAPDESAQAALARELSEELGIQLASAADCRLFMELVHDYPDRRVALGVWTVGPFHGEPRGLEGQALKWLQPAELWAEDLLPADRPIVEKLNAVSDHKLSTKLG